MAKRPLHDILCEVLAAEIAISSLLMEKDMNYPCIVYNTNNDTDFADNIHYRESKRYTVTIIDDDPDSRIPNRLKKLLTALQIEILPVTGCHILFIRCFTADQE